MVIDTNGKVGIGVTNPRDTLEIDGNMRFVNGEDHLMIKPNNTIHTNLRILAIPYKTRMDS